MIEAIGFLSNRGRTIPIGTQLSIIFTPAALDNFDCQQFIVLLIIELIPV